MIRTLIIEDEQDAAERLEGMLLRIEPSITIAARLGSVESSVIWLQQNPLPDLIMLDIQLGDGLSFDIFKKVRPDCFIIFTTAYDAYAIKAFELNSIDYLLKPVDEEKLKAGLEKFHRLRNNQLSINFEKILAMIDGHKKEYKKRFVVSIANKMKMVDTNHVAYFYSMEKSTFLSTIDNLHFPLDFSLDHLETILDPKVFFRINRQYILHDTAIERIHILSKSRIQIQTNPPIADGLLVSSARTAEFRKWLDK
jgi:two-component system, LytTR family, response regulator LytT